MSALGLRGLALGDDRFFCRDGLLEVWLALLVDRMAEQALEAWQESLVAEWRSQATVRFSGVMTSQHDPYVDRRARIDELATVCLELRGALAEGRLVPGPLARRVLRFGVLGLANEDLDRILRAGTETHAGLVRVADSMLWLLGRAPSGLSVGPRPGAGPAGRGAKSPRTRTFGGTSEVR